MFLSHLLVAVITSHTLYAPTSLPPADLALEPQTASSCPSLSRLAHLLRHLKLARVQTQLLRFSPQNSSLRRTLVLPFMIDGSSILSVLQAQKNLRILPAFSFPLKFRSTQETRADNPKRFLTGLSSAQRPGADRPPCSRASVSLQPGTPGRALPPPVHVPGPPRRGCPGCHASRPATQTHSRLRASTQDRLPLLTGSCAQGSLPPKTPLRPPCHSASTAHPASRHTPEA